MEDPPLCRKTRRLKWTEEMKNDLLECKRKALTLSKSSEAPRLENGRKKGYMSIMKELWDELGYESSSFTPQNLRDQAARLEKTLGCVQEVIVNSVGSIEEIRNQGREHEETINNSITNNNLHLNQNLQSECPRNQAGTTDDVLLESANETLLFLNTREGENLQDKILQDFNQNLHVECIQEQLGEFDHELFELANETLSLINTKQGEFIDRKIDTRIKQRPDKSDFNKINGVVSELMKQYSVIPEGEPFNYLWAANCILYSVVVSFLLLKGWKKQQPQQTRSTERIGRSERMKMEYEKKVVKIRKNVSITKAEIERTRENRKLTKRGRKNRAQIKNDCKDMSVAGLISYMEKSKTALRKLKKGYHRKKKQEEARAVNYQFKTDPARVYAEFNEMVCKDKNNERPMYTRKVNNSQENEGKELFENINDASNFWKELWEKEGTGNPSANWLAEVKIAIDGQVSAPCEEEWDLNVTELKKTIRKKKNWSAPGPDRLANFWWKNASSLHKDLVVCFKAIVKTSEEYPRWFAGGKTSLLPKPGPFTSENQRPITCLNTVYKLFTSCLLTPMDKHLEENGLMESQQRGAKKGCSGTVDNLLIDRMVALDCHRNRRNMSTAWVDVRKAFDTVDHGYLLEIMHLHKFPNWLCSTIGKLCFTWNTKITTRTKRGGEVSEIIKFKRGLPQGDALCPRLFTLCLNPVAWKLAASEGYRLSKPIAAKITDLLYIDDLKVFASSESKLKRVLESTKNCMSDIGLQWNPKKCNAINVKKGKLVENSQGLKLDESTIIKSLTEDTQYTFLGVLENVRQEEKLTLECAAKVYLQRLSVIWSSPLSDFNRVTATNQFALPVLGYFMWTQHWSLTDLRKIDRDVRKIIIESGGKHPLGSTALLYLPREKGGRGLRSVEREYKMVKIKSAYKIYKNKDPTIALVRDFEEHSALGGHQSLVSEAQRYAKELDIGLQLTFPDPIISNEKGEAVENGKIKPYLKAIQEKELESIVREERWQGKLTKSRWDDKLNTSNCFAWLKEWKSCPSYTVAGMFELYEQLLPTRLYYAQKTRTAPSNEVSCRLCGKAPESLAHVLAGCSALAQNKYLARHNNALKVLYFEILRDLQMVDSVPPWYSPEKPKPEYSSNEVQAYWDIPIYGEHQELSANRIDAQIINHKTKTVITLEMSCPWIENRKQKDIEKTLKYGPLRWELKEKYPGYEIQQHNIIIDVLGSWSEDLDLSIQKLLGVRGKEVLKNMQKSVISSTLNIARTFKIAT